MSNERIAILSHFEANYFKDLKDVEDF